MQEPGSGLVFRQLCDLSLRPAGYPELLGVHGLQVRLSTFPHSQHGFLTPANSSDIKPFSGILLQWQAKPGTELGLWAQPLCCRFGSHTGLHLYL